MMKKRNGYAYFIVVGVLLAAMILPKAKAQSASKAQVSVMYIDAPLLKELANNPVIQIRIYVPPGNDIMYRSIEMKLNDEAVKAIEKIDVLLRDDNEPAFLSTAK